MPAVGPRTKDKGRGRRALSGILTMTLLCAASGALVSGYVGSLPAEAEDTIMKPERNGKIVMYAMDGADLALRDEDALSLL